MVPLYHSGTETGEDAYTITDSFLTYIRERERVSEWQQTTSPDFSVLFFGNLSDASFICRAQAPEAVCLTDGPAFTASAGR